MEPIFKPAMMLAGPPKASKRSLQAQQVKTPVKPEATPSANSPSSSDDEDKKMQNFSQLRKSLRARMMQCESILSQAGTPTRSPQAMTPMATVTPPSLMNGNAQNEELKKEVDALKGELKERLRHIAELHDAFAEFDSFRADFERLQAERDESRAALAACKDTVQQLRAGRAEVDQELETAKAALEGRDRMIRQLEEQHDKTREALAACMDKVQQLETEKGDVDKELATAKAALLARDSMNRQLAQEHDESRHALAACKEDLQQLRMEKLLLDQELCVTEATLEQHDITIQKLQRESSWKSVLDEQELLEQELLEKRAALDAAITKLECELSAPAVQDGGTFGFRFSGHKVTYVMPGYPASQDLQAGDVIVAIDRVPVAGKEESEVTEMLVGCGGIGLSREVEILRNGVPKLCVLRREALKGPQL